PEQHDGDCRERRADESLSLQPVVQEKDREPNGEKYLHLDHQRRQARRHAELHSEEEHSELADAYREGVPGDVPPRHARTPDEKYHRESRKDEAKADEREGRDFAQGTL